MQIYELLLLSWSDMGVGDDREKPGSMAAARIEGLIPGVERPATPSAKGSDRLPRDRIRPAAPTVRVDPDEISGLVELAEVVVAQKPPADVVSLEEGDKKTRKMEAEQFRKLLVADARAGATTPMPMDVAHAKIAESKPVSVKALADRQAEPRKPATTAELMAQVDEAFADFGPEPAAADGDVALPVAEKPAKLPALIVPDHRLETRFAGAIAPITKPPQPRDSRPRPRAIAEPPPIAIADPPPIASSASAHDVTPGRTRGLSMLIALLAIAIVAATIFVVAR